MNDNVWKCLKLFECNNIFCPADVTEISGVIRFFLIVANDTPEALKIRVFFWCQRIRKTCRNLTTLELV